MPMESVIQIGQQYDVDGSGKIEFDEFAQMMTEWDDMRHGFDRPEVMLDASALQSFLGEIRIVYHSWAGDKVDRRQFSLHTIRLLIAFCGKPQLNEPFARHVNQEEFYLITQSVKFAAWKFTYVDTQGTGSVPISALPSLFKACDVNLPVEVLDTLAR